MESHKWTLAIDLLKKEAQKEYAAYFAGNRAGEYNESKAAYDRYVHLNCAAQYLSLHPGSGELNLGNG